MHTDLNIASAVNWDFEFETKFCMDRFFAVPPDIDDTQSSSDAIVRENANVTLTCKATGSPTPTIHWKRDNGEKISINRTYSGKKFHCNRNKLRIINHVKLYWKFLYSFYTDETVIINKKAKWIHAAKERPSVSVTF